MAGPGGGGQRVVRNVRTGPPTASDRAARGELAAFAELEKSPEHIHTYRISPVSL